LKLLKSSDLFVGVDAGPLHIANAIGIKTIGIFGPTAPETIVDFDWDCAVLRDIHLKGIFCYVKDCIKPICIQNAINNFDMVIFFDKLTEENKECRVCL
jgi:ADP-heptose:LPS heptosyltransferase